MKPNKGEAAFESVDEVLAEKIVENSKEHGNTREDAPTSDSVPENDSFPEKDIEANHTSKRWIIAAVLVALFAVLGCIWFGRCKEYCKTMKW